MHDNYILVNAAFHSQKHQAVSVVALVTRYPAKLSSEVTQTQINLKALALRLGTSFLTINSSWLASMAQSQRAAKQRLISTLTQMILHSLTQMILHSLKLLPFPLWSFSPPPTPHSDAPTSTLSRANDVQNSTTMIIAVHTISTWRPKQC